MLHTSEETHHVVGLLSKWNNAIVDDFNKYVKEVNEFIPSPDRTRQKVEGNSRCLYVFDGKKNSDSNLHHFPSIFNLMSEVDSDPNIDTTLISVAISDGKGQVHLHTDVDTEFIMVERPGDKLFGKKVRQYRAHIAIEIPDDCYFYYVDGKIEKIHWEINKSFIFEKYNKHFVKNNSNLMRAIIIYDFIEGV